MKRTFNIIFLFGFCNFIYTQNSVSNIKSTINILMDNWHKDAKDANFEKYFDAMDTQSVFIGTDANEVWSKNEFKNFSKPYFEKGTTWGFKNLKRNIYIHSSHKIVWFDEILDTWMGICRGSGVLEEIDGVWKIKHYVLSITAPNEDVNAIIKVKQKKDSLFLKSLQN